MKNKQIDLFGNKVSKNKLQEYYNKIKEREAIPLFSETELTPFLNIFKQETNLLRIPENQVIQKLQLLKSITEGIHERERHLFLNKAMELIKGVQSLKTQPYARETLNKIITRFRVLYNLIFLEDWANPKPIIQFQRIISFIELLILISDDINDAIMISGEHDYLLGENEVIGGLILKITNNKLIVTLYGGYEETIYFPLDIEKIKLNVKEPLYRANLLITPDDILREWRIKFSKLFNSKYFLLDSSRIGFDLNSPKPTILVDLNLSNLGLQVIPKELGRFSRLVELDLSCNNISTLPKSLGNLTLLKKLDLSKNSLKRLPESVGNLILLETLNLSNNPLTTLHESVSKLRNLKSLNVKHCERLETLPESLSNLKKLRIYK